MTLFKIKQTTHVVKSNDFLASLAFYQTWLGQPDEEPMENMAEWQLNTGSWLQLDANEPDGAGQSSLVLEVDDLEGVRRDLTAVGLATEAVVDYGFLKISVFLDPDGNRINLVEMTEEKEE